MRPTFEQVKKMLDKMNPNKVSPVDMMMTLVIAALLLTWLAVLLPSLLLEIIFTTDGKVQQTPGVHRR